MRLQTLATASLLLFAGTVLAVGAPKGDIAAGKQRFEATPEGGRPAPAATSKAAPSRSTATRRCSPASTPITSRRR